MDNDLIQTRDLLKNYDKAVAKLTSDKRISTHNRDTVLRFLRDAALGKTVLKRRKKMIGLSTRLAYIHRLYPFLIAVRTDLESVAQDEMERFIEDIESDTIRSQGQRRCGRKSVATDAPFSDAYKADIKRTLKKFYKWLLGESRSYPPLVEWIDSYVPEQEIPALTEAEVQRIIDSCRTSRQRALVQVLFDGGFRISELLGIRLSNVQLRQLDPDRPSSRCFVLRVPHSKTFRRNVPLPMSASSKWLSMWLEDHPSKPTIQPDGTLAAVDTDVPLFPVTANAVRSLLRQLGHKALGKRVWPHLFRHTSATYWSNQGLSYFKLCKRFGWSLTSDMPKRYIDRSGIDEFDAAARFQSDEKTRLSSENERLRRELEAMKAALPQSGPTQATRSQPTPWRELEGGAW